MCRTLLTTEECLCNPNRNPGMTKAQIEAELRSTLGVSEIIWLPRGLAADTDTNGHVDNIACFARPGVVLLSWTDDEGDEQHARSVEALRVLEAARDARGRRLTVIKLPLSKPMHYTAEEVQGLEVRARRQDERMDDGFWMVAAYYMYLHALRKRARRRLQRSIPTQGVSDDDEMARRAGSRLAGSYVNFYICNGGIVMPGWGNAEADARWGRADVWEWLVAVWNMGLLAFHAGNCLQRFPPPPPSSSPSTPRAKAVLQEAFPERKVVQLMTREVLLGGGNVHCITQQQPVGAPAQQLAAL